ncbi:MAG: hypothetical protein U9N45_08005, partial [Gemmatimonadota bacterium]|nr:hypothetical protein [Gemmatimonadota bacterium]
MFAAALFSMLLCLVAAAPNIHAESFSHNDTLLASTDFSRLSPGAFGEFASRGFPEYHHVPREFMDGWTVVNNRGPTEWKVFELEGEYTLEYLGYNSEVWTHGFTYPILCYGDKLWGDYTLEVKITPVSRADVAALNGIIFRYQDGRHYYLFAFGPDESLVLRCRDGEKAFRKDGWHELDSKRLQVDRRRPYRMRVEAYGDKIRCFLDGEKVFDVSDSRYQGGKVGLFACSPVRYHELTVTTTARDKVAFIERKKAVQAELDSLRRCNPKPVLWKRISTSGFGVARAMRLGDLDGDGRLDILLVQNIPLFGGNYNHISCMTALDLDGHKLWQVGNPDPDHAWLTYDVAAQIHDIDDDG